MSLRRSVEEPAPRAALLAPPLSARVSAPSRALVSTPRREVRPTPEACGFTLETMNISEYFTQTFTILAFKVVPRSIGIFTDSEGDMFHAKSCKTLLKDAETVIFNGDWCDWYSGISTEKTFTEFKNGIHHFTVGNRDSNKIRLLFELPKVKELYESKADESVFWAYMCNDGVYQAGGSVAHDNFPEYRQLCVRNSEYDSGPQIWVECMALLMQDLIFSKLKPEEKAQAMNRAAFVKAHLIQTHSFGAPLLVAHIIKDKDPEYKCLNQMITAVYGEGKRWDTPNLKPIKIEDFNDNAITQYIVSKTSADVTDCMIAINDWVNMAVDHLLDKRTHLVFHTKDSSDCDLVCMHGMMKDAKKVASQELFGRMPRALKSADFWQFNKLKKTNGCLWTDPRNNIDVKEWSLAISELYRTGIKYIKDRIYGNHDLVEHTFLLNNPRVMYGEHPCHNLKQYYEMCGVAEDCFISGKDDIIAFFSYLGGSWAPDLPKLPPPTVKTTLHKPTLSVGHIPSVYPVIHCVNRTSSMTVRIDTQYYRPSFCAHIIGTCVDTFVATVKDVSIARNIVSKALDIGDNNELNKLLFELYAHKFWDVVVKVQFGPLIKHDINLRSVLIIVGYTVYHMFVSEEESGNNVVKAMLLSMLSKECCGSGSIFEPPVEHSAQQIVAGAAVFPVELTTSKLMKIASPHPKDCKEEMRTNLQSFAGSSRDDGIDLVNSKQFTVNDINGNAFVYVPYSVNISNDSLIGRVSTLKLDASKVLIVLYSGACVCLDKTIRALKVSSQAPQKTGLSYVKKSEVAKVNETYICLTELIYYLGSLKRENFETDDTDAGILISRNTNLKHILEHISDVYKFDNSNVIAIRDYQYIDYKKGDLDGRMAGKVTWMEDYLRSNVDASFKPQFVTDLGGNGTMKLYKVFYSGDVFDSVQELVYKYITKGREYLSSPPKLLRDSTQKDTFPIEEYIQDGMPEDEIVDGFIEHYNWYVKDVCTLNGEYYDSSQVIVATGKFRDESGPRSSLTKKFQERFKSMDTSFRVLEKADERRYDHLAAKRAAEALKIYDEEYTHILTVGSGSSSTQLGISMRNTNPATYFGTTIDAGVTAIDGGAIMQSKLKNVKKDGYSDK